MKTMKFKSQILFEYVSTTNYTTRREANVDYATMDLRLTEN